MNIWMCFLGTSCLIAGTLGCTVWVHDRTCKKSACPVKYRKNK